MVDGSLTALGFAFPRSQGEGSWDLGYRLQEGES